MLRAKTLVMTLDSALGHVLVLLDTNRRSNFGKGFVRAVHRYGFF